MSNPSKTLEQALSIIEREVGKLEKLSNLPNCTDPLDRSQAAILTDYVKALITARKDEREQAKGDDLHKKSDTELDQLAAEALKYLQSNKPVKPAKKKTTPKRKKGAKNDPGKT